MKKVYTVLFMMVMVFSLASCGAGTAAGGGDGSNGSSQAQISYKDTESLINAMNLEVDETIADLNSEYEKLIADINTYDEYKKNKKKVEEYYAEVTKTSEDLCIRLREYSINYAQLIISSGKSSEDMYDDLEEIYEAIYEDAGDKVYDEIYDGVLDDMYESFYDGVVGDGYDYAPYDEWYDTLSDEYDLWSDTLSGVYDIWSDFGSDIYDFWSDLGSDLWNNDINKAKETINSYQEEVAELKKEEK